MRVIATLSIAAVLWIGNSSFAEPSYHSSRRVFDASEALAELKDLGRLDLPLAQEIAVEGNPSLKAAQARVRQARERVRQAMSAWWPGLDAEASVSRVDQSENEKLRTLAPLQALDPTAEVPDPEDYYSAGLSAVWLLFDGFDRNFTIAAARYGVDEFRAARLESRRLILSAVAGAYYGAQLARENIAIAEADKRFNERQLEDASARREAGAGTLSDVLNFEVRVNAAKADLINAKRSYQLALVGLAELLALPRGRWPEGVQLADLTEESREEMELPREEELVNFALDNRPDLMQLEYALRRRESEIGSARADFYPQVNLSGSVNGARSNSADFEQDDFGNTIGLSLSYNLFSGGARQARLREARESRAEAQENLQSARLAIASEVRQEVARLQAAQAQLELQRANAELVRRNRNLVEKEYLAGQGSLVRLNEAQRDLNNAQARLALALVSVRQAWHDLRSATGQILLWFE